jgi:hypothetical protein
VVCLARSKTWWKKQTAGNMWYTADMNRWPIFSPLLLWGTSEAYSIRARFCPLVRTVTNPNFTSNANSHFPSRGKGQWRRNSAERRKLFWWYLRCVWPSHQRGLVHVFQVVAVSYATHEFSHNIQVRSCLGSTWASLYCISSYIPRSPHEVSSIISQFGIVLTFRSLSCWCSIVQKPLLVVIDKISGYGLRFCTLRHTHRRRGHQVQTCSFVDLPVRPSAKITMILVNLTPEPSVQLQIECIWVTIHLTLHWLQVKKWGCIQCRVFTVEHSRWSSLQSF